MALLDFIPNLPQFLASMAVLVVIFHVLLLGTAYLILLERKIASWAQNRIGPNRVGLPFKLPGLPKHLWGFGQPIADGVKFMAKEDYNPGNVDRGLFIAAPVLAVIPAFIGWAVVPWGGTLEIFGHTVNIVVADVHIGVVYILATGSLAVYGVTVGAWASNNKYTFLGGLRATAQMLSYEIPMGLCVLCVLVVAGTAIPSQLIGEQVGYWHGFIPQWNLFQQPLVAVLFFTCILAEANRAPFDLAECEQELIGGFHTEYSSMKFALFFLGEYVHMIVGSAFFCILFLGGWHMPWVDQLIYGTPQPETVGASGWLAGLLGVMLKISIFLAKVLMLLGLMMHIRWTLPRFRFDQLMQLAWRGLVPMSIGLLLVTGAFVYQGWTGYLWVGNLAVVAVTLLVMPLIPPATETNQRVPLRGSRFSPAPAE